jgi:hypothetical protein
MDVESDEHVSERAELHFLAALLDELMKGLHAQQLLSRDQLQQIEVAATERIGIAPRAW